MTRAGSILTTPTRKAEDQTTVPAKAELRPERLVPLLLSAGVLTPAQALRDGVELVPVGRSHLVYRLEVGGLARCAVKLFGPSRGTTDGSAAREVAVQALGQSVPGLASLLPEPVPHAGPGWLVVTEWVEGRAAWEGDSLVGDGAGSPAADLAELAPRVSPRLAAMHRVTARLQVTRPDGLSPALEGSLPWALSLFDGDAATDLWTHRTVAPLLLEAAMRPRLVAGIRRARGAWRPIALIHGDLKHDNLLLGADGSVRLVDWELARLGDPAWDLAGLMCRALLDPDPERQGWTEANQEAAQVLLRAYAGDTKIPLAPIAQRLVLYCGAWLLMSLVQYHSATPAADPAETNRLLNVVETSLEGGEPLVRALCGHAHVA